MPSTTARYVADRSAASSSAQPWAPLPGETRMPTRSGDREADARFAAMLMAVHGGERDDVAEHLRTEYGANDWDGLLNELFGRADAKV